MSIPENMGTLGSAFPSLLSTVHRVLSILNPMTSVLIKERKGEDSQRSRGHRKTGKTPRGVEGGE